MSTRPSSSPAPARLFIGLLTAEPVLFATAERVLEPAYGPVDFRSEVFRWDMSRYYEREMGAGLLRRFVSFERLVSPAALGAIKRHTNRLEQSFARPPVGTRRLNIDPGYLDATRLVLASTKDQAHRIYLAHGIYAEVTLRYHHGAFQPFDYTYTDYRWPPTHAFLKRLRTRYLEQRRQGTRQGTSSRRTASVKRATLPESSTQACRVCPSAIKAWSASRVMR